MNRKLQWTVPIIGFILICLYFANKKTSQVETRLESDKPAAAHSIASSSALSNTSTNNKTEEGEVSGNANRLPQIDSETKNKLLTRIKDWETEKAVPIKINGSSDTLRMYIPAPDDSIINDLREVLLSAKEDPNLLSKYLQSCNINPQFARIVQYHLNQTDKTKDSIILEQINNADDIKIDPFTGNYTVHVANAQVYGADEIKRYQHLFAIQDEDISADDN